jgi:hypothetical protein
VVVVRVAVLDEKELRQVSEVEARKELAPFLGCSVSSTQVTSLRQFPLTLVRVGLVELLRPQTPPTETTG